MKAYNSFDSVSYKEVYAAGGNYTMFPDTCPIYANHLATYYVNIPGLRQYNNGSDYANILVYDTRTNYIQTSNRKGLYPAFSEISVIAAFAQLLFSKTTSILSTAGVYWDMYGVIGEAISFNTSSDYSVGAYRESQIYDYTVENAYVELPQLYSSKMSVKCIPVDYDFSTGCYARYEWHALDAAAFEIPSIGIYESNYNDYEYAKYVANIYYNNCVINGGWIHGRYAYGGLGG